MSVILLLYYWDEIILFMIVFFYINRFEECTIWWKSCLGYMAHLLGCIFCVSVYVDLHRIIPCNIYDHYRHWSLSWTFIFLLHHYFWPALLPLYESSRLCGICWWVEIKNHTIGGMIILLERWELHLLLQVLELMMHSSIAKYGAVPKLAKQMHRLIKWFKKPWIMPYYLCSLLPLPQQ